MSSLEDDPTLGRDMAKAGVGSIALIAALGEGITGDVPAATVLGIGGLVLIFSSLRPLFKNE